MKIARFFAQPVAVICGSLIALSAIAQPAADVTRGEVRKIDKDASKITLQHSEIKSLDMPPMTMVFTVKNPALLDKVKPGDSVEFNAERQDGKIILTDIKVAPPTK